jgi:alkanesulfonate monooxygenase SsuD/methylene tetrahydromethanopterin reductase-like flavin-dependent oxidoreductase (luciferase family)
MEFDIFCSLARTPVGGRLPDEATVLRDFLRQAEAADRLGYGTLWVAESHYSIQLQKTHRRPVVPHWQGDIGLNTDICQLAAQVFARTRRIEVGSAIMNIVGNGGPLPAAERVATALSWHGLDPGEHRKLYVGFAGGRFDYINRLTGVVPRAGWEERAWPQVRTAALREATEVFLRLLTGEGLSSADVEPPRLRRDDFPDDAAWDDARRGAGARGDEIVVPRRWEFERTALVPADWRRELWQPVLGSHDPWLQVRANDIAPVRVFNLSITPPEVIEATHERMRRAFHPAGGPWRRGYLPRTTLVFVDADRARAHERATAALGAYWHALEGTLDPARLRRDVRNALIGTPGDVAAQITERFHPDDRLMLWFDFFDHDGDRVIDGMTAMMEEVVPRLTRHDVPVVADRVC